MSYFYITQLTNFTLRYHTKYAELTVQERNA